jgi:hypothetical protein
MNKTWLIIEKVIGVLLGIWGIIALYGITTTVADMVNSGYAAFNRVTTLQLILQNHLQFLIAIGSVFGGALLLFNDKQGWILCVISAALFIFSLMQSSQANATDSSQPYYAFFKSYSLMALLFIAIMILLTQKPFLKKYQITTKNWLWIIGIIAVLIMDKLLF